MCPSLFFNKIAGLTLAQVFFCEFCEIFTKLFLVTGFDIRIQVVVIYTLNLSLQFVTINFTFSLLSL